MPPPGAGGPRAENLAGEAPGSGHRGFELHGQVVIDAAQWYGVYEALEK